jgi:hypothetical protein
MSNSKKSDQYSDEETKRRAEQALKGAFKTPPPHDKRTNEKPKDKRS